MKASQWLVVSLIVVFIFSCTLPTGGNPTPSQGGETPSVLISPASDTTTPIPPASDTPTPLPPASNTPASTAPPPASDTPTPVTPQGRNVHTSLDIPSQNDPAPAGILEQLSWGGVGGGEFSQVCGNCQVGMKNNQLTLSNFQPSQKLMLSIYRSKGETQCAAGTAEYVTTLSIQVDEKGKFTADLNGPTNDLYVVSVLDAKTGYKIWKSYQVRYDQYSYCSNYQNIRSCPGAPPQKLQIGRIAYVCTSNDSVKLREGAGKNYPTIQYLKPGEVVEVIAGPECGDNWSWWKVVTKGDIAGWMSEGGDNTDPYFLCPKP